MKLHLPKQLFTALLAAITLAAAPAALTLGSAAWGVEDADSTDWSGSDSNTWYVTSDTENALESIDATTIDNASVFIRATKDDVVRTVETLTLKNADTLTIAGDWDSATAHFDALTIESLVIGSGEQPGSANLTVGAAQSGGTPAQAVTINSLTGSVGNLNLGASSTLTLNGPVAFVADSVLTLNNNSNLILNNAGTVELNSRDTGKGIKATGAGTITIGSGTTINMTNTVRPGSTGAIEGSVVVLGGGKLQLSGNSASLLGYDGGATDNVYLRGSSAESMATMEFATNKAQHLTTNLYLEGYAQITDSTAAGTFAFIECYGGGITATGTQNTIATSLFVNKSTTINVTGTNDELTITGQILSDSTGDELTKSGAGTLTIAGEGLHGVFYSSGNGTITESDIKFSFVNSAGTTNINANTAFYKLQVSGGKVNINSDVTVKNTLTLSSKNLLAISADASLTLNPGTITFSNDSMVTGAGTLHIMDGTTLVMSPSNNGTAAVKGNTIHVHGGGILNLNGNDCLGWGSNATGAILLEGESEMLEGESETKVATLQLGGRQTMTTNLTMMGNALVESTGGTGGDAGGLNPLKAGGAQITATGKNNIINATLHRRDAFLIEVTGANDELEVQGNVVTHDGNTTSQGYDGSYEAGSIVKDGDGKLTFSGSGNTFDKKYLHKDGTSVMSGTANFTSTVEIQIGKFETSGTTTMSGAITNSGTFEVSGGTATISGAVTNSSAITVSGGTASFTNTLDMGADSSLSVTDGSATLSGALNVTGTGVQIGQSGTGVLDITGQVSVAEVAALTMGGTITLNHTITNDGTLTLNGAIYLTGDITTGFVEETTGGVTYSGTLEGQEETYNGFKTISGATYKLTQSSDGVSGTVTNTLGGNFATDSAGKTVVYHGVDEYEVTSKDGQLYFSTGTITGTEYYITTDEVVVDDAVRAVATGYTLQGGIMKLQGGSVATSNITYTSGSVALSDAATLIIDVADNSTTATHWLTNTTGDASTSIEIAANANFGEVSDSPSDAKYTTSFSGKWVVSNGATLKLGGLNSGQNNAYVVNLLSLESLDLDGGNLRFFGDSGKLDQVNVKQNARFDIYEMYDDDSLLNIEKLNLEANLTMDTDWRSHVNIEALSGAGRFVIESGSTYSTFKANVTDEYTGVFDLNHSADKMYVELNVAENATATIEGDRDTSINKLTLKKGASFNIDTNGGSNLGFTYSLGSVDIEDSATIQTTQAYNGWQAEVNIGSLTGNADAVLNIISNTSTTQRSIINLNGGNFDGTVNVTGSSSGGERKIALNVNDSTVLADAVVSMHGNGNHVALAIGGTEGNSVTLKGINDQENANGTIVIVSGAQNYDTNADFLSANEYDSHTLVIDTDGSGESDPNATESTYSTKATISAGLNLQKDGNGKQTFSGDFSRFDGSVTVNGGTLEITTADTSSKSWGITTATVNQGASLRLGGTVTVGSMSAAGSIALDADSTLSLGGGTHSIGTLSGSGVLSVNSGESAAATLSINTLAGYTGSLNAVGYGANTGTITALTGGEVSLTGITLDNATATITTNNNSYKTQSLGNVTLSNGATLGISDTAALNGYQTINISKLDVHGSGNLKTTTAADGWQAQFNISTLTGDTGVDGTLRFSTNSKTTNKTVFNLNGAGDVLFSGNISVGVDNNGDSRKAALNINNASVAQKAIITLESPINCNQPGSVMLGVGVDGATVRGIKDGENPSGGYSGGNRYIDSGQYTTDSENLINDELNRTLVIATQNGDDFSSSATIGNYVSLQKDNNGSQTFNGNLSNFNGSIKVTGGTLALESSQAMNNAGNVTVTGGTLHVSNDISTTKLTVANEGIAKFDSTLTAKAAQLGETATVTGGSMSKVQMSSTGITGTAQDGSSSISDADIKVLAQDASFTIEDMTLTNTSITAASVNIEDSKVSGNVVLNVVKPTEAKDITAPNVGQGVTEGKISFSYGLALVNSSSSLTLNMEVPQAILPSESGLYTLSITLNGFAEGFNFNNIDSQVVFGAGSWLDQALTGASTSVTVDGETISAGAAAAQSSGAPSVSYNATSASDGNVGSLVITINGLNVPEPASATLGLAALMMLCARRRRKA